MIIAVTAIIQLHWNVQPTSRSLALLIPANCAPVNICVPELHADPERAEVDAI